jgi:hypothetical protein
MKAKRRKKPMTIGELGTLIRKGRRKTLANWSEKWKPLFVYGTADGVIVSKYLSSAADGPSSKGVLLQFKWAEVPLEARPLVTTLIDMLHEQSTTAYLASGIAAFDIDLQKTRSVKGVDAGKRSAKPSRSAVEQKVRARLRRNEDPKP